MSQEQLQQGKAWIEEKLRQLSQEYGVPLKQLEWYQSSKDFDRDMHSLKIVASGKSHIEKFSGKNLEDCPADENLRLDLYERLKKLSSLCKVGTAHQ